MRTSVPFRMIGGENVLLIVRARFQDAEPIDCALDTGASHCVLLPAAAARFGVRADRALEAMGAGGRMRIHMGRADRVSVGEIAAQDVDVMVTGELERIGAAIGHPIEGNLGHSFLGRYRLGVDYEAGMIELADPDEPALGGAPRAELEFSLAHPSKPLVMIDVRLGGRSARFALDTGASSTVISADLARQLTLETQAIPDLTGGGGTVRASAGELPELTLGGLRVSRVRVAVADFLAMLSGAIGTQIDGIIGTNVLRRFRVTIDYPRRRVRLD